MTIRELWHTDQHHSEIRSKKINSTKREPIIIRSLYSLISTGTERIVCRGEVPLEMEKIMEVPGMEGSFRFPVKYGYSLAGIVEQGPTDISGKKVHLMYPHQDYVAGNITGLSIVPEKIPVQRAVLASNMETALTAVWDSGISAGDEVLVSGFGLIGALIAIILSRIPAVNVTISEPDTFRKNLAKSFGFPLFEENTLPGRGFDCAINAAPSEISLQQCIDVTVQGALIVDVSWHGTSAVRLNLGTSFHAGRKRLISSQVSSIPQPKADRFSFARRKKIAFKILEDEIFDRLPVGEVSFAHAPSVFDQLRNGTYDQFCTRINYT